MDGAIASETTKIGVQNLVELVKGEVQYFCCFSSYVAKFDRKKTQLNAKLQDVNETIERARGASTVTKVAQDWAHEATSAIDFDTRKEKCFDDLCLNCWQQYKKSKDLAERIQQIDDLLGRPNFDILAHAADLPGIKYLSLDNFMRFESREPIFQDLKKALEDEDCNMIGLYGLGGTGKTSMAIQVGAELEGSKKFDKVIFLVVSQSPDFKKIRLNLAKRLDLKLKEEEEEQHPEQIWCKISKMEKKLLIILDDVWEELDLKQDLGIPSSHQHKGCSVLITTRNSHVGCPNIIPIQILNHKDALDLFLANASIKDSSPDFRSEAEKIVKKCGGLPVAIVATARALRNRLLDAWRDALKTLENHDANPSLTDAHKCLKLSYDYLKNEKSKEMFLISSLFPEDFEIPKQLLSKIAIGLGLFGEVERYHSVESKAHKAIQDLVDSSLFLTTSNKECVKIHDLVREVALQIGEKDIRWIMDFKTPIKENLRYLAWKSDGFPDELDGPKLESLMIFLSGSKDLKVPHAFFEEMKSLKVLYLSYDDEQISAPKLLYSLQSLRDIRILNLLNFQLGDISLVGNLPRLEGLWLSRCSIIEFPKEILKLKKLVLLEVESCKIKMNNPFKVIERCLQLEELSFVGNQLDKGKACSVSENLCPYPSLQRYKISQWIPDYENIYKTYGLTSRWFFPDDLQNQISKATFKQFVRMAEILRLGNYKETGWKNLIPDIVPVEDGGMSDLIVLHLYSWPDIKCLVDGKKHENDVNAFSKLVELNLNRMYNVEDLYQGCLPSGFLERLEIMRFRRCHKLRNIFFDVKLSPCHLKVMKLVDCPKWMSIFPSVTAQRLTQLEKLTIKNCDSLEHILQLGDENDEKSFDSLFPKLKTLKVEGCGRLKIVLPILVGGGLALSLEKIRIRECEQLSYLFDKFRKEDRIMLPSLKEMELSQVPSFINIFREYHHHGPVSLSMQSSSPPPVPRKKTAALLFSGAQMCCFYHKSSEETHVAICKDRVPNNTMHQGSLASMKSSEIITRELGHIKKLKLSHTSSNLVSLSMALSILWEELTIEECDELKHLITVEENDYDKDQTISCHSVFPKLKKLEIIGCKDLEFLFPSTTSIRFENLKRLVVKNAPELNYVVGKYHHVEDHVSNVELHFELPALEFICIKDVPKFISILAKNYSLSWPSLQSITLENRNIKSFTHDLLVCSKGQLNKKPMKELDVSVNVMPPIQATRCLSIQSLYNVKEMKLLNFSNSRTLLTLPMASMILWEKLTIKRCGQLKYIVADQEDIGALMYNHKPIFPKLKELVISECDALEYLFAANAFRSPSHLKSLSIWNASELKYVFGTSHHENRNIQTCIDFPTLEELSFRSLPKLVSICPRNYYLRGLSLKSFDSVLTPDFDIKSLTSFMVCAFGAQLDYSTYAEEMKMHLRSLDSVEFIKPKIEEIFDLTHMGTQKNGEGHEQLTSTLRWLWLKDLSELKNICVGPKSILSLNNISQLKIIGCNKLKVIFSDSVLKSLPKLRWLNISSCEELTHILEENADDNDHLCHEPCFPVLFRLTVEHCDKLKYLFSITVSGILPKLEFLSIRESSNLEHVFIRRDETKEKVMIDVLPQIEGLILHKLSSFVSICCEVDFRTLEQYSRVRDCPQFSFYETTITHVQDGSKFIDSQSIVETKEKLSSHINIGEVNEKQGQPQQFSTLPPNDELVGKEVKNKGIMMDSQQSMVGTSNITQDDELAGNEKTKINLQQPTNGTSKSRKTNKEAGYSDITKELNANTMETTVQLPSSEPINTMPTTHVSFSQDTSSNIVEERHEECISRETTDPSSSASKKKPPVPKSWKLDVLSIGGITGKTNEIFEPEEEQEDDVQVPNKSQALAIASSGSIAMKEGSVFQSEPNINGKIVESHDWIKSDIAEDTKLSASPFTTPIELMPSFLPGVQEIVDMMKLEDSERSIFVKALETRPQLQLSTEDRSTRVQCMSYRVLLDILNILTTRTPFSITEVDKRLLGEHLKDAYLLGFDKDWVGSIKAKVFDCDETFSIQEVLKGLENDLKSNESMLEDIRDKELEAARVVQVAQQEHANLMARHAHLLKARQDIMARWHQCWEKIAAKNRHFGF